MRERWIPVVAFALLVAFFAIDLATPQTLVVAILFAVPIVIVALAGSRRLTGAMVVLALVADAVAGYFNGVREGSTWGLIGLGDRLLAAFSIVMVGYLSITIQEQGQRAGRAAAQQQRAKREAQLAAAIDRLRASLSYDLVVRAIVKEAAALFSSTPVRWLPASDDGEDLITANGTDVTTSGQSSQSETRSVLQRALDGGGVETFGGDDAFGRTVTRFVGAPWAMVIPFQDAGRPFGALLLGIHERPGPELTAVGRAYARAGSAALAQADLFEELARRNDRLAERGAVIRDLVYTLSHDARTPLAALQMTLIQAREGAYGALPDRYRSVLDASIASTRDVLDLAETLLRVARLETGEETPLREPVDVAAMARDVAGEFAALAGEHGVAIVASADSPAIATGDPGDLRRAIRNLVGNAIAHAPAGGHVTLDVRVESGWIGVVVTDDGPGVAPSVRDALFGRFVSGTPARGVGLGLYLVRRVAESLGGSVEYRPAEPHGSVFTIRLPRTPAGAAA